MPKIPYRRTYFPKQLWLVEDGPFETRRVIHDPPPGYVRGASKAELMREYPQLLGRKVARIQGPEFPEEVEEYRQSMLEHLEDERELYEYNQRAKALNEYLGLPKDVRDRYSANFIDSPIEYEGQPVSLDELIELGRNRSLPNLPDWIMDAPWRK